MKSHEIQLSPLLKIDSREVAVFGWEPLWSRRHVFKHVLDTREGWQVFYGASANLNVLRQRLLEIGCKGYGENRVDEKAMHGPPCSSFAECDKALGDLYPQYEKLILDTIREGSVIPRHTHNLILVQTVNGRVLRIPTNYFLSFSTGVLAETYEELKERRIRFRTAYRDPPFRHSERVAEFVRRAQEQVCFTRRKDVKRYCTWERWSSGLNRRPVGVRPPVVWQVKERNWERMKELPRNSPKPARLRNQQGKKEEKRKASLPLDCLTLSVRRKRGDLTK